MSGFHFLHIDPSVPVRDENLSIENILARLFELYGYVHEFAKQKNRNVQFELGTEEQNGYGQDLVQFEYFLSETQKFCEKNNITKPTFVVAQTGTKVMEMQNIGVFSDDLTGNNQLSLDDVRNTIRLCEKYDVLLKEHNTDYLGNEALSLRPIIGIHASNVAPEFGVVETKGLLYLLQIFGYKNEFDLFVKTAVESGKWKKWMLKESAASELDKALICGHYIFALEHIRQLKSEVSVKLIKKGVHMDEFLKNLIKQSMLRYVQLFNMI
jgi:hypothetical protein